MNKKRQTLKKVASVSAVAALMPTTWTKPILSSVVLPAHAQTSVSGRFTIQGSQLACLVSGPDTTRSDNNKYYQVNDLVAVTRLEMSTSEPNNGNDYISFNTTLSDGPLGNVISIMSSSSQRFFSLAQFFVLPQNTNECVIANQTGPGFTPFLENATTPIELVFTSFSGVEYKANGTFTHVNTFPAPNSANLIISDFVVAPA
ncbi:MAG: hypothetical protein AAF431_11265 [Pseudomonadota bacterium]